MPKYFNTVSGIKVKSYTNAKEKKKWPDLMKEIGKFDEMFNYIVSEYMEFIQKTNKVNLHQFCEEHDYMSYDLLALIGLDEIKAAANIARMRHSDEDLENNFNILVKRFGYVPLYTIFDKETSISLVTYATRLGLKGKVYDKVVEKYVKDEKLLLEYKNRKRVHKSDVGRETGILSYVEITDEFLEEDFTTKFNEFLSKYNVNPPKRTFNKLLTHNISTYRKRYKLSWLELCKKYGFTVTEEANRSEAITLKNVEEVLNEKYLPQKTWDWLIGSGGKHMYCDGYFPDHNVVIEFDGSQHRKPVKAFGGYEKFLIRQKNDALKDSLLKDHNIRLVRIRSDSKFYDIQYIRKILIENGIIHK